MFFDVNQHYCPLESPTTRHSIPGELPTDVLYPKQFEVIIPFLRSRPPCKLSLGSGCASLLIHALDQGVRIGSLKICGSRVVDEDMERFLSAENSKYLLELSLPIHSIRISRSGRDAFATFLRRSSTTIQKLDFGKGGLDVEGAQTLLRSIPPSSTLRRIEFGRLYQRGDKESYDTVVQILRDLICDQSSFAALCGSNHRLEHIGRDQARVTNSSALREALQINGRQGCSANQKCRSKLRAFYFQGEFDTRPFVDMDVALMPNVLELVTMSEECLGDEKKGRAKRGTYVTARNGHLDGIYRLVRTCHLPELFQFPSQQDEIARLRARNAALKTTIGSLTQKIEWLNEKMLYLCAPASYYEPNKRLKRKARQ